MNFLKVTSSTSEIGSDSNYSKLSNELKQMIMDFIPASDLLSMRLTSVESATLSCITFERLFRRITLLATFLSFHRVRAISNSKPLNKAVHSLDILLPWDLTPPSNEQHAAVVANHVAEVENDNHEMFKFHSSLETQQTQLMFSMLFKGFIEHVLANFPNLHTIRYWPAVLVQDQNKKCNLINLGLAASKNDNSRFIVEFPNIEPGIENLQRCDARTSKIAALVGTIVTTLGHYILRDSPPVIQLLGPQPLQHLTALDLNYIQMPASQTFDSRVSALLPKVKTLRLRSEGDHHTPLIQSFYENANLPALQRLAVYAEHSSPIYVDHFHKFLFRHQGTIQELVLIGVKLRRVFKMAQEWWNQTKPALKKCKLSRLAIYSSNVYTDECKKTERCIEVFPESDRKDAETVVWMFAPGKPITGYDLKGPKIDEQLDSLLIPLYRVYDGYSRQLSV